MSNENISVSPSLPSSIAFVWVIEATHYRGIGNVADAAEIPSTAAPTPLLGAGQGVNWWFVFKFNAASFPGCAGGEERTCTFGGSVQNYKAFSQQFVYASSEQPSFQQ